MSRLYLIRHAQSANNEIWDGSDYSAHRTPDPELTELGHQQAQVLAEHLSNPEQEPRQHPYKSSSQRGFALTHLYCSLMTRSILTGQYIAKACSLPLTAHMDYFEKDGIYEIDSQGNFVGQPGENLDYFASRFPQLVLPDTLSSNGWWDRPVETEQQFLKRIKTVVTDLKCTLTDDSKNIGLIAHGDFIDQFLNELMGIRRHNENYNSDWCANWVFHNTALTRIDFINDSFNVVYTNRIDHLPSKLVTW